jgi:tRNA(Ile)-lysidine synthase
LLHKDTFKTLKDKKNLLAFSAGVDSTALFFKLLEVGIEFDIAIVNYQTRKESFEEEKQAMSLAKEFNKKIFVKRVKLKESNFEKEARVVRYEFFKSLDYENIITAHHLNDRFEWFLMQLSKGAGVVELLGFEFCSTFGEKKLIRPFINTSKEKILSYLKKNNIKYFYDKSNSDTKYKRNYIRQKFSDEFIKEYEKGVKKSFEYLSLDKDELFEYELLFNEKNLFILKRFESRVKNIRQIDYCLKSLGYILSSSQKEEILNNNSVVISSKYAISFTKNSIFINPFITPVMTKKFKEECRVLKIPQKARGYIFESDIEINSLKEFV